jgi:hypothetical protein
MGLNCELGVCQSRDGQQRKKRSRRRIWMKWAPIIVRPWNFLSWRRIEQKDGDLNRSPQGHQGVRAPSSFSAEIN